MILNMKPNETKGEIEMSTVTTLAFAGWKSLKAKVLGWSSWDTEQALFVLMILSLMAAFCAFVLWLNIAINLANPAYGPLKQLFAVR